MALTGKIFSKPSSANSSASLSARLRVHLVDGDQNRFAAAAQAAGDFAVQRHDAFLHIDDQHDDVRRFDGQFHLFQRGLDDDIVGFFARATGRCRRCPRA